ncbi:copper chaperone PCu(A)C [Rhodobacteraceae bacterium DSL-40]|uniref:copper chaperone PCu(A)C n=1 Tax=Amaricoccus sp. B4 TaxID=3368557 RepID=UPI0013A6CF2F
MHRLRIAALAVLLGIALLPGARAGEAAPLAGRDGIRIEDAYARAAGAAARSGAVYLTLANTGTAEDTLLAVTGDAAARIEIHSTVVEDGIARMQPHADGLPLPAGARVSLAPGGLHIMLLGLTRPLAEGDTVGLTFVFERAGAIPAAVPVDLARGMPGGQHTH